VNNSDPSAYLSDFPVTQDKIEGTWRVSGLVGDDVRAGTFEAHR